MNNSVKNLSVIWLKTKLHLPRELRKGLPKMGKRVVTADGEGRVVEVDVLHQRIRVSLGQGEFKVYPAKEVERMFPAQQPNQPGAAKKSRSRAPGADQAKPEAEAAPAPSADEQKTQTSDEQAPREPQAPTSNDTMTADEPDSGEPES